MTYPRCSFFIERNIVKTFYSKISSTLSISYIAAHISESRDEGWMEEEANKLPTNLQEPGKM